MRGRKKIVFSSFICRCLSFFSSPFIAWFSFQIIIVSKKNSISVNLDIKLHCECALILHRFSIHAYEFNEKGLEFQNVFFFFSIFLSFNFYFSFAEIHLSQRFTYMFTNQLFFFRIYDNRLPFHCASRIEQ